ncbi:hypothetical protein BD310DRAFT_181031 [Dichomitus squalens]|uniref:Uncharacterized protein n=1 Tax=Dichomitus squalens TaxID=114155 RepID=A0A4Q9PDZ3_9APHY|nr:hypothetical protein BD310DRAFT_181031 [Dichomitus squalens]
MHTATERWTQGVVAEVRAIPALTSVRAGAAPSNCDRETCLNVGIICICRRRPQNQTPPTRASGCLSGSWQKHRAYTSVCVWTDIRQRLTDWRARERRGHRFTPHSGQAQGTLVAPKYNTGIASTDTVRREKLRASICQDGLELVIRRRSVRRPGSERTLRRSGTVSS